MAEAKRNVYSHVVSLAPLRLPNAPREDFRRSLEKLPYLAYEVEVLGDGRKIVISKPGGKFTYGRIRREDFLVWVYGPTDDSLWLISHKDIYQALLAKGRKDPKKTVRLIGIFERIFAGEEPDALLPEIKKVDVREGESAELLLKAYKWIWGQEDCNYPEGEGREMSMMAIRNLKRSFAREGRKRGRRTL